jgi:hypothetical protein
VIHRRECDLRFNLLVEILEHCIVKILCVVDCDVSGHAIAADDVLPEEFFDCCGAYISERLHLYPLHEIFDCHLSEGVIVLRWGLTCQQCQCSTTEGARTGRVTTLAVLGPSTCGNFFDKLRMWRQVSLHHQLLQANRNLAGGPWRPKLWCLCGLHKFLHGSPTICLDLQFY